MVSFSWQWRRSTSFSNTKNKTSPLNTVGRISVATPRSSLSRKNRDVGVHPLKLRFCMVAGDECLDLLDAQRRHVNHHQ